MRKKIGNLNAWYMHYLLLQRKIKFRASTLYHSQQNIYKNYYLCEEIVKCDRIKMSLKTDQYTAQMIYSISG